MRPIDPLLTVASPPHVHSGRTFKGMTLETIAALLPAAAMAVFHFGMPAARVIMLSTAICIVTETICWKMAKRPNEVNDYTAVLTGIMLAFLFPASAPWWLVTVGAVCAMVLGKMIYGGNGGNPLGAALLGWAACRISWGGLLDPYTTILNTTLRAPLHELKYFGWHAVQGVDATSLLMGAQLGGLGAAQTGAIILGGMYILARRIIRPEIPLAYILGITLTAFIFQQIHPEQAGSPLFHLLAGGTMFGAFFLATDHAPSPVMPVPMILYGLMGGVFTMLIREYGIYPDGVPFALLLAQLATPLLDRIGPTPFGLAKAKARTG